MLLAASPAWPAGPEEQQIERIEFRGNEAIGSSALRKAMRLKQPVWWNPFRNTRYMGSDYLALDLYRVLDLYRDRGFPLASIREADIRLSEDAQKVVLDIDIAEGPRYWFGGADVEGVHGVSAKEVRRKINLKQGNVLSRSKVEASRVAIEAMYGEAGFLSALVRSDLDLRGDTASVIFRVREGLLYRFRSTIVDTSGGGLRKTHPEVLRREVLIKPGAAMRASRILKTQERIFDTGLFRTVRVTPTIDTTGAPLADLRITAHERKFGWYGFGGGYSSDDRLHVLAEWGNRNVSGMARRLEAYGDLAFALSPNSGRHRFAVQSGLGRFQYSEPWFLFSRMTNQISASHTYEQQAAFDQDITSLDDGLRRDIGRYSRIGIGVTNKWVRTGNPTSNRSRYVTRNISAYVEEDNRDNLLDARRGSYKQLLGEFAGGLLGGVAQFNRWNATGSWYRPLNGRMIAAFRVRAGVIIPVGRGVSQAGEQQRVFRVPDEERFRLGGGTSVRGYAEGSLGQVDTLGVSIGGTAIALGNIELRFPLFWLFSGAIFVDGGNVWADPQEIKPSRFFDGLRSGRMNPHDMSYGAGGGLRFLTPVGPFRVDYGFKLGSMRQAGHKNGELYLSLGQAF
jgi:outer membrane protein insertion porin family